MTQDIIRIVGAYQNNLKNVTLNIPKHCWTTITGVSGSGKSTLIFDIIYAQAQKEFLESLSAYTRRNFPKIGDVNVQTISGLSPCVVIDQSSFPNTPRSTVGTYTDIYSYLRLLFSRAGNSMLSAGDFSFNNARGACEECNGLGEAMLPALDRLLDKDLSLNEGAIQHKTWKVGSRYWNIIRAIDYFDMDKKVRDFTEEEMQKLLYSEPFVYQNKEPGYVESFSYEGIVRRLKKRKSDDRGLVAAEYDGQFFISGECPVCHGARLRANALKVKIADKYTIADCVNMEVQDLYKVLQDIHGDVEDAIIPLILKALKRLIDVGMGYITLNRSAFTLSGGEAQKVKLAKALGCSLTDMIYILDEPTAGLHPSDAYRMKDIIRGLVEAGNTALVIEHNRDMITSSDRLIEIGPGAGIYGGEIIYNDKTSDFLRGCPESITAPYLTKLKNKLKSTVRPPQGWLSLRDIHSNNVRHEDLDIPQKVFTCLTGVSGAGKSTVLNELVQRNPNAVVVDQNLVGGTVRGNAATYTKAFDSIRRYFSSRFPFSASDFSFNSNGSCEVCNGLGYIVTDMHFIGDIRTPCESCDGKRYKKEILKCHIRGKNISDVLDMTVLEALKYFEPEKSICAKLQPLSKVGLEYITLGQPLNTLSGGELQRLKLASKIQNKGELYVFDEPTHGLHFKDTQKLIDLMNHLVDCGNTVVVVEHNLDVIAQADWVIDLGPLGGKNGGRVIFRGIPEKLCQCEASLTGKSLRDFLQ